MDSYERMPYESLFSLNPGRSRTIFLEEISTTEYTIDDTVLLRQKVYDLMEKKLLEYKASWISEP